MAESKLAKLLNNGTKFNLNGVEVTVKHLTYRQLAALETKQEAWATDESVNTIEAEIGLFDHIFESSGVEAKAEDVITADLRYTGVLRKILVAAGLAPEDDEAAKNAPAENPPPTPETAP